MAAILEADRQVFLPRRFGWTQTSNPSVISQAATQGFLQPMFHNQNNLNVDHKSNYDKFGKTNLNVEIAEKYLEIKRKNSTGCI